MAEKNRITVCSSLLSAILDSNKELLIELQFTNAIGRYRKEHPVLNRLSISEDLVIDAAELPDNEEAVIAIKALIKAARSIIELFSGTEEAKDAIIGPARKFQEANGADIDKYDLNSYFPDLFAFAGEIDLEDLRGEREIDQLAIIFSRLFSIALRAEGVGRQGIENVLKKYDFIKGIQVGMEEARIYLLPDASSSEVLNGLSDSFNSLEVPMNMVAPEIAKFGTLVEELGILKRLYGGLLSSKVDFGISVIDDALGNDISKEYIFLLRGPKGIAKDMVSILYAKKGLEAGEDVVFVNSTESTQKVIKRFEMVGIDAKKLMDEKRLLLVDWYSKNVERVHGVEVDGSIIRCSDDLTNVGVALDIAFQKMGDNPSRRGIVNLISPASVTHDFETVLDFVSALCAKLRANDCFSLVTMNDEMHERRELSAIQDNFDGVLQVWRSLKNGLMRHGVGVMSFSGMFSADLMPIEIDARGITIGDPVIGRSSYQSFTGSDVDRVVTGIPGLEILTGGGLPKHGSFLVLIPAGLFPAEVITQFSMDCMTKEQGLVMVVSSTSPSEYIARFHEKGIQTPILMKSNRLRIVDWHSQRNQRIMGVDDRGGVLCASVDIMHLGVAIDLALKQLDYDREVQAVVDTLSSSLRDYDLRTVYQFAQSMRAKFHKRGITSFVILEKGTQTQKILATMEEIFDGTLDISDIDGQLEIGVLGMKDTHYDSQFRPLLKMRSGLAVDITGKIERKGEPTVSSLASDSIGGAVSDDVIRSISSELDNVHHDREQLEKRAAEMEKNEAELKDRLEKLQQKLDNMENDQNAMAGNREELAKCLTMLDDMLEELPDKTIEEFAQSEEFELYNKVLDKYLGDDDKEEDEPEDKADKEEDEKEDENDDGTA